MQVGSFEKWSNLYLVESDVYFFSYLNVTLLVARLGSVLTSVESVIYCSVDADNLSQIQTYKHVKYDNCP